MCLCFASNLQTKLYDKWLLFLLADDEPKVVVLAAKILARLMVVNGSSYVQKFAGKTSGMVIMQHRIKRWWTLPAIWLICFAVLFGQDVASLDMERPFNHYNLLESFGAKAQTQVVYPEILPVITAMLQAGLRAVTREEADSSPPLVEKRSTSRISDNSIPFPVEHKKSPSRVLHRDLPKIGERPCMKYEARY